MCRSALSSEVSVPVRDQVIGVVQISRHELERVSVDGANAREVPTVECGDLGDSEAFGCYHD